VVFSRDGRSVAFIGEEWVQVVDSASGDRRFKAPKALWSGRVCEFAPDGGSLAIVSEVRARKFQAGHWRGSSILTSTIAWLDSQTGSVRREIEVPESYVRSLALSPDGQAIAVGTLLTHPARGIIRIFRLRDKNEIQTIESPCPWIEVLTFTTDGRRIVAGMSDTSIVIWDVRPTD
jgi:WD40 repeat protein